MQQRLQLHIRRRAPIRYGRKRGQHAVGCTLLPGSGIGGIHHRRNGRSALHERLHLLCAMHNRLWHARPQRAIQAMRAGCPPRPQLVQRHDPACGAVKRGGFGCFRLLQRLGLQARGRCGTAGKFVALQHTLHLEGDRAGAVVQQAKLKQLVKVRRDDGLGAGRAAAPHAGGEVPNGAGEQCYSVCRRHSEGMNGTISGCSNVHDGDVGVAWLHTSGRGALPKLIHQQERVGGA